MCVFWDQLKSLFLFPIMVCFIIFMLVTKDIKFKLLIFCINFATHNIHW